MAMFLTGRRVRHLEPHPGGGDLRQLEDLTNRVEQAVDSLAGRVEELANGQEFLNRVLSDRLDKLGRALPLPEARDPSRSAPYPNLGGVALIKAALNGARRPGTHPALPVTPTALAAASAAAVTAGARANHLPVLARHGGESLAPPDGGPTPAAGPAAVPRTPVGISTGARVARDPAAR